MAVFFRQPCSGVSFAVSGTRIGTVFEQDVDRLYSPHLSSSHQRSLSGQTVLPIHIGSLRNKQAYHVCMTFYCGTGEWSRTTSVFVVDVVAFAEKAYDEASAAMRCCLNHEITSV